MCAVTSLGDKVNSSCTSGSQVNYEEECTFSCSTGYELIGPSSVNCTSSGNFSHSFPECQVTCEVSELGENVNSSCTPGEEVSLNQEFTCEVSKFGENVNSSCTPGEEVSLNQACTFSCPTGYDLTGQSSVTCTSSRNFSDPFPQCQSK
nr:E-selectin-like [Lytechinus pictus]